MPLRSLLLAVLPVLPPGTVQSDAASGLALEPAVTARELEAHVRFLAGDELAGRETATPGTRIAAEYLSGILERSGVQPAGGGGTWYQVVPLERETRVRTAVLALLRADGGRVDLEDGVGFSLAARGPSTDELEVLAVREASDVPALSRPDAALWIDAERQTALEWLEASGHADGRGFGLVLLPGRSKEGRHARRPSGRASLRLVEREARAPAFARVHGEALSGLRAGRVLSARLDAGTDVEALRCQNVVGRLPGRRPDEWIVLSAHYDHLGRLPEDGPAEDSSGEEPDRIFNGADDDASGCAAVLEIAGALAAGPAPERGLVVLLATGEEHGLLGTRQYLASPVVPLEETVLNLNFEMIGRPDPELGPGRLWLTGWERSNLGAALRSAGLSIAPDGRPEQDFFRRSDNFAFARLGVVAQTLSSYGMHADYHQTSDEWTTLDYDHMQTAVETALEAVRLVAGGELDPAWLPGGDPSSE